MRLVRLQARLRPLRGAALQTQAERAPQVTEKAARDAMTQANPQIISDQLVRDRIRDDLDVTLVIEAAAGTGKTTALVNRIVSVIGSGRGELARIVAVTFTEKAAGELKLRLRAEIERARQCTEPLSEGRARFDLALKQLEEARIGTIHSFCADLLRERPVEAHVDPMFEVAPEDVAGEMFDAAFERWFEKILDNPGEGMRRLLRRRDLSSRTGPRAIARRAALELMNWRDFDSPWQHSPMERDSEIDAIIAEVEALGKLAELGEDDDWLAEGFGESEREEVFRRRADVRVRLEKFRDDAGANLAPLLRDELWPIVGIYEDIKRRAGRLDFLDLLLVARNLVRDNPAVRAELQSRFTHIFVDEFQDTDPLQAEIILLLSSADPAETNWLKVKPIDGKLFIVGDPKQSIYRFRPPAVSLHRGCTNL